MEQALIHQDEEVRYLAVMLTWFCCWRVLRGTWPQLPSGELNLSQEMKEEIDRHFAKALVYNMLTIGEMQALKMLVALQCLTEAGPR